MSFIFAGVYNLNAYGGTIQSYESYVETTSCIFHNNIGGAGGASTNSSFDNKGIYCNVNSFPSGGAAVWVYYVSSTNNNYKDNYILYQGAVLRLDNLYHQIILGLAQVLQFVEFQFW